MDNNTDVPVEISMIRVYQRLVHEAVEALEKGEHETALMLLKSFDILAGRDGKAGQ